MERPSTLRILILSCIGLCISLQAAASDTDRQLVEYEAQYIIEKYNSEIARAKYRLKKHDNEYRFTNHTELTGFMSLFRDDSVTELSTLDNNNELQLRNYQYTQSGSDKNRNVELNIHTGKQQATGSYANTPFTIQLVGRVWDPHSVQIALMQDVNDAIESYRYHVIHKGIMKHYDFVRQGKETVSIDGTDYDTIVLLRTHGKRSTRFWLSINHNYVPVRIEQYRNRELKTRLLLDSFNFLKTSE